MTNSEDSVDGDTESLLGPLSIIGGLSLCCIGFGAIAGGAAITGGTAGTAVAIGATTARGTLVSLLVTAITVSVVAVVGRWYLDRS